MVNIVSFLLENYRILSGKKNLDTGHKFSLGPTTLCHEDRCTVLIECILILLMYEKMVKRPSSFKHLLMVKIASFLQNAGSTLLKQNDNSLPQISLGNVTQSYEDGYTLLLEYF